MLPSAQIISFGAARTCLEKGNRLNFVPSSWGNDNGAGERVRSKAFISQKLTLCPDSTGPKQKRFSGHAPPHSSSLEAAEDECQALGPHSLSSPRQGLRKSQAQSAMGGSRHGAFPAGAPLLHLLLCSRASVSSPAMVF